jgi:GNAT superfamily N-acetyltransferase
MNDWEIRPARSEDFRALTAALGDDDFFTDRLARQCDGRGVLLTAWAAGWPIGEVYLWLEPADEPEVREHLPEVPLLNHVEVHAEHRNRGVGTSLVAAAELFLSERGYDRVALAVRIDNIDAGRLYERLGYQMWDHPPVVCMYEVKLTDGSRKRCPETCYLLVKALPASNA